MSYAPQRSMNGELAEGMVEGTFKRLAKDRGGFVETTTTDARTDLYPINFSYNETSVKDQPDGTVRHAQGTVYYRTPMRHQG